LSCSSSILGPGDLELGLGRLLAGVDDLDGVLAGLLRRELDLAVGAVAVVLGDLLLVGVVDEQVDVGLGVALDGDRGLLVGGEGQGDVPLAPRLQLERLALEVFRLVLVLVLVVLGPRATQRCFSFTAQRCRF
jgi:hypothetical protein